MLSMLYKFLYRDADKGECLYVSEKIEEIENSHIKLTFQFKTWLSTRSRWPLTWRNMTKHKLFIAKVVGVLVGLIILFGLTTSPTNAQGPGGSTCSQAGNCEEVLLDDETQSGDYVVLTYVTLVTLKAGQTRIDVYPVNGNYNDGCYSVQFSSNQPSGQTNTVAFSKVGGEECQNLSHIEIWWHVAPTGVTLKSLSANGDRSPLYMVGVPILLFLAAITLAFLTWRHRRNKNNQIGG